jgi:hypothetical protein
VEELEEKLGAQIRSSVERDTQATLLARKS